MYQKFPKFPTKLEFQLLSQVTKTNAYLFFSAFAHHVMCERGQLLIHGVPPFSDDICRLLLLFLFTGRNFKAHRRTCTYICMHANAQAHSALQTGYSSQQQQRRRRTKKKCKSVPSFRALKSAHAFRYSMVPHHWHITASRIERPKKMYAVNKHTKPHTEHQKRRLHRNRRWSEEKNEKRFVALRTVFSSGNLNQTPTYVVCVHGVYVLCCTWDDDMRMGIASLWFNLNIAVVLDVESACGFLIIMHRKC